MPVTSAAKTQQITGDSPLVVPSEEPRHWIPVRYKRRPSPKTDKAGARYKWPARKDKGLSCMTLGVKQDFVRELTAKFSPLDVEWELQQAAEWSEANPSKRKTYNGMRTFLTSWMSRAFQRQVRLFNRDDLDEARDIREGLLEPAGSKKRCAAEFDLRIPYRRRVLESSGDPYGWPYWEPRSIMRRMTWEQFIELDGSLANDCLPERPVVFSCYGYLSQKDMRDLKQLIAVHSGEVFSPFADRVLQEGWPLLFRVSPHREDFGRWCKDQVESLVRSTIDAE